MATYRKWLEEQLGREDGTGQLSQAIKAQGYGPRGHSAAGVEKYLRLCEGINTDWAMERHAAALAEYRKSRGDLQPVPQMGEDKGPEPEPESEPEPFDRTEALLAILNSQLGAMRIQLGAIMEHLGVHTAFDGPDPVDWQVLFAAADFSEPPPVAAEEQAAG